MSSPAPAPPDAGLPESSPRPVDTGGTGSGGTGSTSTAATGRSMWRVSRGPVLAAVALVLAAIAVTAVGSPSNDEQLDPRSYAPDGARALATLLDDRDVDVQVVGDVPAARAAAGPGSTVLVPRPAALTEDELTELGHLDAPLVVLGAGTDEVKALGLQVDVAHPDLAVRSPRCTLPAARTAGTATSGRTSYQATGDVRAVGCYPTRGRATVLELTDLRRTLVGAPDLITNDRLAEDGNAALALGLLDGGDRVVWLLPRVGRDLPGGRQSVRDLLPDGILLGALQLLVAVVLLALWRARRLGRVVVEPLPIVVRAAEAVEGRGRLYRAAGARDAAAAALRAGARDRLARALGLPPEPDRRALVATLAERSGRDPAEVDALLYGAVPTDDSALVRLADHLDRLVA